MGKTIASSLNMGEVVISAIKKITKNTGWTTRTITKFIRMEYNIQDPKISRKVSKALKRGVRLGLLQMEQGRYKLNDMCRLAKPISVKYFQVRPKLQKMKRERGLRIQNSEESDENSE